ncbi:hypothetical protein [Caldimonas tepidiphila]|uniref:hypothetical protein n=1 Tax=Caldimonas tepidiphila TaxID=2315841 RepID=UPI0013007A27|nr:hypothetical protein [Caldimonas tepidiphila]
MNNKFTIDSRQKFTLRANGKVFVKLVGVSDGNGEISVVSQSSAVVASLSFKEAEVDLNINDQENSERQRERAKAFFDSINGREGFWGAIKGVISKATFLSGEESSDDGAIFVEVALPPSFKNILAITENADFLFEGMAVGELDLRGNNLKARCAPDVSIKSINLESNNLRLEFSATQELAGAKIKSNNAKINVMRNDGFDGVFEVKANSSKIEGVLGGANHSKKISIKANNLKLRVS